MKVLDGEGVATYTGPESCVYTRKGMGEVLTGDVQAGLLSRERCCKLPPNIDSGGLLKKCWHTIYYISHKQQKNLTFLPQATARFHRNFTHHTFGSVKNIGLLTLLIQSGSCYVQFMPGINTSTDFLDFALV